MLFRYIKFVDMTIEKEFIFNSQHKQDVINYIIQHPKQFELPDYFYAENKDYQIYICDKDSLELYWAEQSYSSDGLIKCKIEEIRADIFI